MTVPDVFAYVLDALDIETLLVCTSEEEGKRIALELAKKLGFKDVDIVFIRFQGSGVRVRIRAYINRPGDQYAWLDLEDVGEVKN